MNAYNLILAMITTGGYKLAEIQAKIKRMFLIGDITEEQFEELMQRSVQGATPDGERPEMLQLIETLAVQVADLEARVAILEGGTVEPGTGTDPDAPAYPVWEPWDGISSKYQPGAIVWHSGKLWRSDYPGQNVWEPGAVGTKGMWIEWVEDEPGSEVVEDDPGNVSL